MIANTCNDKITETLRNALNTSSGKIKVDINNAIVSINRFFSKQTDPIKIKSFVKATLQKLKIFRDYKTKILNLLNKLH